MGRDTFALCSGILALLLFPPAPPPASAAEPTGEGIIREALDRHETNRALCEELTMVLTGPRGERSVRELRSYLRETRAEGTRFLLVIDAPPELAGVSLLVRRLPSGETESSLYLPAFGKELKRAMPGGGGPFLDTEFTPLDLLGEPRDGFRYQLADDARIDLIDYWVVEALPQGEAIAAQTGYGKRKIFVRKDTRFISRIDYLDLDGRLIKRQTRHDLKRIEGESFLANMVLMEGGSSRQQTLLRRNRRVYAEDCAPEELFTPGGIFANPHRAEGKEAEEEASETNKEEGALP